MTAAQLEKRIDALEAEVARLKARMGSKRPINPRWYIDNAGRFANDPVYAEIVRLGREYRESQRPGRKARAKPAKSRA